MCLGLRNIRIPRVTEPLEERNAGHSSLVAWHPAAATTHRSIVNVAIELAQASPLGVGSEPDPPREAGLRQTPHDRRFEC